VISESNAIFMLFMS